MKKFLTSILSQNVAYETLVQLTKPWTLYSVSVQRYRGSKMKNSQKERFFGNSFEKTHDADFFRKLFRRKCSLGSCAIFSEIKMSVSVLGFEKFASQV